MPSPENFLFKPVIKNLCSDFSIHTNIIHYARSKKELIVHCFQLSFLCVVVSCEEIPFTSIHLNTKMIYCLECRIKTNKANIQETRIDNG